MSDCVLEEVHLPFERQTKRLYRSIVGGLERRRRARLEFVFLSRRGKSPTVYFLAPDYDVPAGGNLVIYRHVDYLNSAGIRSYALHERSGFRYTWFDNATETTDLKAAVLRLGDLLVVSELNVDLLTRLRSGVRHVIFNQNSHLTWARQSAQAGRHYVPSPDLAAVVTVSEHNAAMLRRAFRDIDVCRVHLGIDRSLFYPTLGKRDRIIGYMPRRGGSDAAQVFALLQSRGALEGWQVIPIDGLSHAGVAAQLRQTKIFLAFTHQEGFGLPAAEAMACGNYVIGNHGFGGREFFLPNFSVSVDNGDILGFADAIEDAVTRDRADPDWCSSRGRTAAAYILSTYSSVRERADVIGLYRSLLESDTESVAVPSRVVLELGVAQPPAS